MEWWRRGGGRLLDSELLVSGHCQGSGGKGEGPDWLSQSCGKKIAVEDVEGEVRELIREVIAEGCR
jgi:hypothetical protein